MSILTTSRNKKVQSLADQIYESLRSDIINGVLPPGDRIVELDIASEMGTSQSPVREALQRLERQGLVEKQARSATFVTQPSIDEIFELFSIRSLIEGFAIRRTVCCITPEQCDQLEMLIEQMQIAGQQNDMYQLTQIDMLFHRQIVLWSDSTALLRAWDPLFSQIQCFVVQTHKDYFEELTDLANTHLPIIEALKSGDGDEAARILQEHVMLIWSKIEEKRD